MFGVDAAADAHEEAAFFVLGEDADGGGVEGVEDLLEGEGTVGGAVLGFVEEAEAFLVDGLDAAGADALRSEGETAQKEATDIVRFTRVLKDAIPHEDRVEILEAVWRVVYADGEGEAAGPQDEA